MKDKSNLIDSPDDFCQILMQGDPRIFKHVVRHYQDTFPEGVYGSRLDTAIRILGGEHVVSRPQALAAHGKIAHITSSESEEALVVPFLQKDLEDRATQNSIGTHEWFLVYDQGYSPMELYVYQHTSLIEEFSAEEREYFLQPLANKWAQDAENNPWCTQHREPGYHLVDLGAPETNPHTWKSRLAYEHYAEQQTMIEELGPSFMRAADAVVIESAFVVEKIHKRSILSGWQHLGSTRVQLKNDGQLLLRIWNVLPLDISGEDERVMGQTILAAIEFLPLQ